MKTKLTLASLLLCVFALNAAAAPSKNPSIQKSINPQLAIRAIIGEAAGEGDIGMIAVAAAIRNRGHLRGVYGGRNPIARNPSDALLKRAERAWARSASLDITRGATHWENVRAFGKPYWADSLTVTTNIGRHTFYK